MSLYRCVRSYIHLYRLLLCLLFGTATRRGGDDGIRTHDPLLAGQVLSQLSYTPIGGSCSTLVEQLCVGIDLSSRTVARKVLSTLVSLTSVFGMGTGGPSPFVTPTILFYCSGFGP